MGGDKVPFFNSTYLPNNWSGGAIVSPGINEETVTQKLLSKLPDTIQLHAVMNVRFRHGFVWLQNLCSFHDNKTKEKKSERWYV